MMVKQQRRHNNSSNTEKGTTKKKAIRRNCVTKFSLLDMDVKAIMLTADNKVDGIPQIDNSHKKVNSSQNEELTLKKQSRRLSWYVYSLNKALSNMHLKGSDINKR